MSIPIPIDEQIRKYLGQSGVLARNLQSYEFRPQQLQMATLIRRALDERRFGLIEAGTGTGKTLAYLIPALLSGRRVVVSTATKTLQDQIVGKDLPLLRQVAGMEFTACVLKGRANYICRYRLEQALSAGQIHLFNEMQREFQRVCDWSNHTKTGEWAELGLHENHPIQRELSCTSESCPGRKCPFNSTCFVTRARHEAAEADLIVVNHHLLFADLALKTDYPDSSASVLPNYQAVVFDEAHAVEDVATDFFGITLSAFRATSLVDDAMRALAEKPASCPLLIPLLDRLSQFALRFFNLRGMGLTESDPIRRLTPSDAPELETQAESLVDTLRALPGAMAPLESLEKDTLIRRATQLANDFDFLLTISDPRFVYWEENRGKGQSILRCAPIDVAGEFRRRLYTMVDTAIFTSATLASEGKLEFTRRRLGLPEEATAKKSTPPEALSTHFAPTDGPLPNPQASKLTIQVDELILDSPFDYGAQAALYTPRHLPEPNAPDFIQQAAKEIEELCTITNGRALLLFTSLKNMKQAYELLRHRLPYTVMCQSEGPRSKLLRRFMDESPCVLFASQSFWEGVDIPGETLSLVVIDKLPFASPSDPVVSARVEWLKAQGRSAFSIYQLPQAALSLRQGFGRLVRTQKDTGIVAVLDPRLTTKGYGKVFLRSLPPAHHCTTLEEARSFWVSRHERFDRQLKAVPQEKNQLSPQKHQNTSSAPTTSTRRKRAAFDKQDAPLPP